MIRNKHMAPAKIFLILFFAFSASTESSSQIVEEAIDLKDRFGLQLSCKRFGIDDGQLYPVFTVKDGHFYHTLEQTGYNSPGATRRKPDTIRAGFFRQSSIRSIINMVNTCEFQLRRTTNLGIYGGSIWSLKISYGDKTVRFEVTNSGDNLVNRIFMILNQYVKGRSNRFWRGKTGHPNSKSSFQSIE